MSHSGKIARTALLAGALMLLALGPGAALAQGSEDNPRCAQMVNVAACTCSLENGGTIRPDGRGFSDGRGPAARAGYLACMKRRGR